MVLRPQATDSHGTLSVCEIWGRSSTRQGNYTCEFPFSASLDAGRRYTLKASSVDASPRSTGKCRLELVDAATGAQPSLVMRLKEKASEEFICKQ
jgi:hypothetical protein